MNRPRLKGATRALIHDIGGLEAAAHIVGLSVAQLGRYQHLGADDFITIASVATLEAQAGVYPHVTQTLAAMGGHILVPRPTVEGEGKWAAHLAATVKETGDFLSRFGSALANDGKVNADEAEALLPEVDEALSALTALRLELEKQTKPEPAPRG